MLGTPSPEWAFVSLGPTGFVSPSWGPTRSGSLDAEPGTVATVREAPGRGPQEKGCWTRGGTGKAKQAGVPAAHQPQPGPGGEGGFGGRKCSVSCTH